VRLAALSERVDIDYPDAGEPGCEQTDVVWIAGEQDARRLAYGLSDNKGVRCVHASGFGQEPTCRASEIEIGVGHDCTRE